MRSLLFGRGPEVVVLRPEYTRRMSASKLRFITVRRSLVAECRRTAVALQPITAQAAAENPLFAVWATRAPGAQQQSRP
jgi:hypothetical protein